MNIESLKIPCVGYSIAADFYQGESDEVLLVLIGFSSNKGKYEKETKKILQKTGMSALVVDYSGHGESPFELTEVTPAQNFSEAVIAFDWLASKGYSQQNINVMGISYGGFHATHLAHYRSFNNLILRVPAMYDPESFYTKLKHVTDTHRHDYRRNIDNFNDHWLFRNNDAFTGKTFVMAHELDELCPKVSTDAFVDGMKAKSKHEAKGFGHGTPSITDKPQETEEYFNVIAKWLNS